MTSHQSIGLQGVNVGVAERVITPPAGGALSGFGARKGVSQGVHDDLHVRCMVIEGAATSVAVLSASVVDLNQDIVDQTRREVSARTGMPGENIMMAATHTHSGPNLTPEYAAFLKDRCVESLVDAWTHREPGRLGIGAGHVDDVARNRRRLDYGGMPVDPEVGIIKVENAEGTIKAVLFNYACHPTTMGPDNLLITEDWPYYAIGTIKENLPDGTVVIFVNGAEGDINPGYSAGLSAIGAHIPIRTWSYAERIGARLGRVVAEQLGRIETKSAFPVASLSKQVLLPLRKSFAVTTEEARKRLEAARETLDRLEREGSTSRVVRDRAEVEIEFAEMLSKQAGKFHSQKPETSVCVELQSLRLDDAVLTTFPGEVFSEVGLEVKRRSPFSKTLVIGLANAGRTGGYLPTREAFAEGDYEVLASRYDEQAAEVLIEATIEQVSQLK